MQDRYVIFTNENQGLETYLGSGEQAKRVDLGNTPEAIAAFPLSVSATETTACSSCWNREQAVNSINVIETFLYIFNVHLIVDQYKKLLVSLC